jgi:hypothetical protein
LARALDFGLFDFRRDDTNHTCRYLILEVEHVGKCPIDLLCPQMCTRRRFKSSSSPISRE